MHLFERLAEAEAAIHDTPIEKVHLHEVGALDSIIDIVGAVYGFDWFGIDDVVSSPLNVGGGTVHCAHGEFPVPAPATARLLAGVPVYGSGTSELVTPTGALLVTGYARSFGPLPAMRLDAMGYGAGDRDPKGTPNVLRILRGERAPATGPDRRSLGEGGDERIVKIECEIDDMNPQLFGPLMDGLLAAGALDVFYTPVQMKKSRPGTLVTIIAPDGPPSRADRPAVQGVDDDRRPVRRDVADLPGPGRGDRHDAVRRRAVQDRPPGRAGAERLARVRRLRPPGRRARRLGQGRPGRRGQRPQQTSDRIDRIWPAASTSRRRLTTSTALRIWAHAYEKITADAIARYKRLCGVDTLFVLGNDEHSQNVYRLAKEQGLDPLAYCDRMEREYRAVWKLLDISYDDFIRTTQPRHKAAVQELVRRIAANGDVYEGFYEGWYCVGCEAFKQEKDLVDGKCPLHSTVDWIKEKNHFFRLSKYRDPLLAHFAAHPEFVEPEARRNEILKLLESGLDDISISRAGQSWGIPVPHDPSSVVYVWFDALINYASAVGFGTDEALFAKWWPADLHVIGKDITRFPHGDLAGDADERRAAGAAAGVRARVHVGRRPADEQVARQRRRSHRRGGGRSASIRCGCT